MHGVDAESLVNLGFFYSLVHPDDRERVAEEIRRSHSPAGDGLFDDEHRLLLPDGSIRWTSTRSQTFFEGQGEGRHPVRTVGAVRVITPWKRAQEEQKKLVSVVERAASSSQSRHRGETSFT